jgi:transcriptional regulator NrdR family protein
MSNKRSMLSKNYKKSNVNSDHIENISTSINQSIQQSNREINRNKFFVII